MKKHEANPYKEILTYLVSAANSFDEALTLIGIDEDDYKNLFEENHIEIATARKIMSAYASLKGLKNVS